MSRFRLHPLPAALLGAGIALVGSAGALSLNPADWFKQKTAAPVAAETAAPAAAQVQPNAPSPVVPVAPTNANGIAPLAAPNYRGIVKQFGPAVVSVTVEGTHKAAGFEGLPPGAEDDPFFQFFRGIPGFGQRGRRGGGAAEVPFRGQGSGFIVSTDGLVLTNAHVVREAKEVTVKLQDRREFRAKVLGQDPATDVAVLRIEGKNLPAVRLGDPKQVEVGDPVLAIGAPYSLEQTATQGIVSAKGRSLPGDNTVVPFIQTDAAVNPGNSGGPLFDGAGNVIGINAQIYSQTGGYQGLSFAIPIDVALKVKDQIVAHGKATHARLGVQVQDLTQPLAESFGLPRPDGALVAGVQPGSAADKAGLKSGDVITEVNGEPVLRGGELSSRIGLAAPGDKVKLKVWRDKGQRDMEVKLGAADDDVQRAAADDDAADGPRLGLALRPLNPREKAGSRLDHGLVVEDAGGPAGRAGVVPGDVLLAVNGKPVDSIEDVKGVLKGKPKNVALLIERDGDRIFVPVRLG